MKLIDYFRGIWGLVIVAILVILAIVFFAVFNMLYVAALFFLAIIAILLLPYYFGRKNKPEKEDNYLLNKVKE